jgi:Nuclear pore protein 84 / 107
VEDTHIRKEIEKINKRYFSEELARKFMVALAENGINQAATLAEEQEFLDTMTPDDQKALEIIQWLYEQQDLRNAFYYTNEFSRKLLLQDRYRGVQHIMNKFQVNVPVE